MLPSILGAKRAATENDNHRVLPLQLRQFPMLAGVIGKVVIGETNTRNDVRAHMNAYPWPPIIRTTRKRALPLCICSYASATRVSGYFSIIGWTPVSALNSNVSCESRAVPEYEPSMDRLPAIMGNIGTGKGSRGAAGGTSVPLGGGPSRSAEFAFPSGGVATLPRAPQSFWNWGTPPPVSVSM